MKSFGTSWYSGRPATDPQTHMTQSLYIAYEKRDILRQPRQSVGMCQERNSLMYSNHSSHVVQIYTISHLYPVLQSDSMYPQFSFVNAWKIDGFSTKRSKFAAGKAVKAPEKKLSTFQITIFMHILQLL
jgi:hypothetical protein